MSTSLHQCPKCKGGMEQGFVLDGIYGGRVVSRWAPGAHLPLFVVRLPRVVRPAGVCSKIETARG